MASLDGANWGAVAGRSRVSATLATCCHTVEFGQRQSGALLFQRVARLAQRTVASAQAMLPRCLPAVARGDGRANCGTNAQHPRVAGR